MVALLLLAMIHSHSPCYGAGSYQQRAALDAIKSLNIRLRPELDAIAANARRPPPLFLKLAQGASLRIASDLTLGTPLENLKKRVSSTEESFVDAFRHFKVQGFNSFYTGTPARLLEGSMIGGLFVVTSSATRKTIICRGGSPVLASLLGGLIGGLSQTIVMAPSTQIFTSTSANVGSFEAMKNLYEKNGIVKGFYGAAPSLAFRQATNWASRASLTEIARSNLKLSRYGLKGEVLSGVLGGLASSWNTPIEVVRIRLQSDLAKGRKTKSFGAYFDEIRNQEGGFMNFYRGWTPRVQQAIWQTCFMVVGPRVLF